MKKKRVKYLAVRNTFHGTTIGTYEELFSLKDEVKEFKLHNIEVQRYDFLFVHQVNYHFIKESD